MMNNTPLSESLREKSVRSSLNYDSGLKFTNLSYKKN